VRQARLSHPPIDRGPAAGPSPTPGRDRPDIRVGSAGRSKRRRQLRPPWRLNQASRSIAGTAAWAARLGTRLCSSCGCAAMPR